MNGRFSDDGIFDRGPFYEGNRDRVPNDVTDLTWRIAERSAVPLQEPRPALRAQLDELVGWCWVVIDMAADRIVATGPSAQAAWEAAEATGETIDDPWEFPWPTKRP